MVLRSQRRCGESLCGAELCRFLAWSCFRVVVLVHWCMPPPSLASEYTSVQILRNITVCVGLRLLACLCACLVSVLGRSASWRCTWRVACQTKTMGQWQCGNGNGIVCKRALRIRKRYVRKC